ncbi:hypothetical protein [Bradyrhizobium prioriisuperbiae]|nr:hypothetical protein [Bradyrhizobium prioritasuperba]
MAFILLPLQFHQRVIPGQIVTGFTIDHKQIIESLLDTTEVMG